MCCSGGAPAPDPMIGQAAAANAAVAKEALDFYKSVYDTDIKPMQIKDQELRAGLVGDMRSTLQQQKQFAEEQNKFYTDTFQPIERRVAKEAMEYDSDANIQRNMGIAAANMNQQFSNARGQGLRALSRYGIGVNPEQFARENMKLTTAQALGTAGAQTGAVTEARDKGIALRAGAANFGRNMPNTAATYYAGAGNAAGGASGISSAGFANTATGAGIMGQGFGTSIQGNQSSGNLMLGDFNARMEGYKADQAATGGLFSGLGQLGGMALMSGMPASMGGGSLLGYMMKRADGGPIDGPGGPRDDMVPAMLSKGEYVLNEGAVKHFGLAKLNKMNEVGLQNQEARGLIRRA